jgi:hypothetical protein
MDGAARIAEDLLTFKFTTSAHAVASETMPNQISLRCALAVIKEFMPSSKLRNPMLRSQLESISNFQSCSKCSRLSRNAGRCKRLKNREKLAPRARFELATFRLTAVGVENLNGPIWCRL